MSICKSTHTETFVWDVVSLYQTVPHKYGTARATSCSLYLLYKRLISQSPTHLHEHTYHCPIWHLWQEGLRFQYYGRARVCLCVCMCCCRVEQTVSEGNCHLNTARSANWFLKSLYCVLFLLQGVWIMSNYRTVKQAHYKNLMEKELKATRGQQRQETPCIVVVTLSKWWY